MHSYNSPELHIGTPALHSPVAFCDCHSDIYGRLHKPARKPGDAKAPKSPILDPSSLCNGDAERACCKRVKEISRAQE